MSLGVIKLSGSGSTEHYRVCSVAAPLALVMEIRSDRDLVCVCDAAMLGVRLQRSILKQQDINIETHQ